MALVDQDQVEEFRRILLVVAADILALGNGLVDGEKNVRIGRHDAVSTPDLFTIDLDKILLIGVEGVDGLVGEDVAISQKQNAGSA